MLKFKNGDKVRVIGTDKVSVVLSYAGALHGCDRYIVRGICDRTFDNPGGAGIIVGQKLELVVEADG